MLHKHSLLLGTYFTFLSLNEMIACASKKYLYSRYLMNNASFMVFNLRKTVLNKQTCFIALDTYFRIKWMIFAILLDAYPIYLKNLL